MKDDLDQLLKSLHLRKIAEIATAYFVVPDERNDPEPGDEG